MSELTTVTQSFAQKVAQLKSKVSNTNWKHEQFIGGANAGAFVGTKDNGKFFILVSATKLVGGNNATRKAILGIDPQATGLTPDMFQSKLSNEETKALIESLFGAKAKIILVENISPMWENQQPSIDKNGEIFLKGGLPIYRQTRIEGAESADIILDEAKIKTTSFAEELPI